MTFRANGSPSFYQLLEQMADIHDRKSHDYASNDSPFANYQFAGKLSQLFKNSDDAGFIGRIGEKLYRLANLENNGKHPSNESVSDTEVDICVIVALWIASRRERRSKNEVNQYREAASNLAEPGQECNYTCYDCKGRFLDKPQSISNLKFCAICYRNRMSSLGGPETTEAQAEKLYRDTSIHDQMVGKVEKTGPLVSGIQAQLHALNNTELLQIKNYIKYKFKV